MAASATLINRRYELQEKLGQGGMGVVHQAFDRLTRQTVALKQVLIPAECLDFKLSQHDSTQLRTLADEFRVLASLRHPHIISVLDYGFHHAKPYFTMEYLRGSQNIIDAARGKKLSEKVRYLNELLLALDYLHRRDVLHRDLKPDNVLVTADGQVKVLDFGLSEKVRPRKDGDMADMPAGTLAYMAPELLKMQSDPSIKSDFYALGLIMYEIFKGEHPFDLDDPGILVDEIFYSIPDVSGLAEPVGHLLARLLSKDPDDRYHSARKLIGELVYATDQVAPDESQDIRESYIQAAPLTGRDTEIQQLQSALEEAVNGHGQSYLVGGESGVGKSRLLEELRIEALVQGVLVLRGQATEGVGLPFQLWRTLLRRLLLEIDPSLIQKQILKEIVPDIHDLLPGEPIPDAPALDGHAGHERLIMAIVDCFKQLDRPVLLILEDLQWAVESLEPLQSLNRIIAGLPLLIMGSYRNDERPQLPEHLPEMTVLSLKRLDERSIEALSPLMLGEVGKLDAVLDILIHQSAGNAFFMVEVARTLAEAGDKLGQWTDIELSDRFLTVGMKEILTRRLAKVPEYYQEALQIAALAGRQPDEKILLHILPELTPSSEGTASGDTSSKLSIDDFVRRCVDAAVLEIVDEVWRFSHDKLREAALNALSVQTKVQFHQRIAEAIEAVYPDSPAHHELLLEHWHQAGNLAKEIRYLQGVAEQFINIQADYAIAERLLNRSLEQLSDMDVRRISLLNQLAATCWHRAEFERAWELAEQALQLARATKDTSGIAQSQFTLGTILERQGNYPEATSYFESSLTHYTKLNDQRGIADSMSTLGLLASFAGDPDKANKYLNESMALYRVLDNQEGIADSLGVLGTLALKNRDNALCERLYRKSLEMSEKNGNQSGLASSLNNMGIIMEVTGRFADSREYYQKSLKIRERIGDQRGISVCSNNLGFIALHFKEKSACAYFWRALFLGNALNAIRLKLDAIIGFANLCASTNAEYAGELAGLVQHHPEAGDDTRRRLQHYLPPLEAALNPAALKAAMERGQMLDLESTVQKLLAEFAPT